MFGWMRRLSRRRPRRHVFKFHDGQRWQHRDAVVLCYRLREQDPAWFDRSQELAALYPTTPETAGRALELTVELAGVVSRAFQVPLLWNTGEGMTTSDLLNLLADYITFYTSFAVADLEANRG